MAIHLPPRLRRLETIQWVNVARNFVTIQNNQDSTEASSAQASGNDAGDC